MTFGCAFVFAILEFRNLSVVTIDGVDIDHTHEPDAIGDGFGAGSGFSSGWDRSAFQTQDLQSKLPLHLPSSSSSAARCDSQFQNARTIAGGKPSIHSFGSDVLKQQVEHQSDPSSVLDGD